MIIGDLSAEQSFLSACGCSWQIVGKTEDLLYRLIVRHERSNSCQDSGSDRGILPSLAILREDGIAELIDGHAGRLPHAKCDILNWNAANLDSIVF